jgi:hypothetical protein
MYMEPKRKQSFLDLLFPERRFDSDFPLVFWFGGLWFYLKSFLYICYVYIQGLEPQPYPFKVVLETAYFGIAIIPAFLVGLAMWNEKKWVVLPAIAFLVLDTPMLLLHIMRLGDAGFLDSGLTKVLEFGSLGLNLLALGWLIASRTPQVSTMKPRA